MPKINKKSYYAGDASTIAQALAPHVGVPAFVKYAEVRNSKVDKASIVAQSHLVCCLLRLQGNLAFSQAKLADALKQIGRSKGFFADDVATLVQWAGACARRLRTMSRHFRQSVLKARGRSTSWVALVLNGTDDDHQARPLLRSSLHTHPATQNASS